MLPMSLTIFIILSLTCSISVVSFSFPYGNRIRLPSSVYSPIKATIEHDNLFWPSSPSLARIGVTESISPDGIIDEYDENDTLDLTLDSVVKVYATHSEPDYLIPWQKKHQTTSTSSGFVLNVPGMGYRVMTNAHSVEYGSVVQVQLRGDDEKYEALVEAVGNECDLALLRVDSLFPTNNSMSGDNDDDDNDDTTTFAMPLGPLPSLQGEVEVLGYPAGGDSLCVTKGVVSRIEMQEYAQAGARLLAMQIDAAINPGNSGGPVVNEHLEVVGVAFQGVDEESIENVGFVVPSSVVLHFLEDVRRNNEYTGFCHLGIEVSFLENQTFRKYLKLDSKDVTSSINGSGDALKRKRSNGVMVRKIQTSSGAFDILQSNDVILEVDSIPLGNDGKIPFRRGERVDLGGYITSLFEGDEVHLIIWRDGKEMDISFPVSIIKSLVPAHFNNKPPPYLIASGLVFTALSVPYLDCKGAWDDFYSGSVSYLLNKIHEPIEKEGDEVVVLAQVLAHKANLGYEHYYDLHLLKFNDEDVRSLQHLKKLIDVSDDPFMKFEFGPKDGGRIIILDRLNNEQVTNDVCSEHSIGKHFALL